MSELIYDELLRKELTVGELKKALENVPDDLHVELLSDTGVDQGRLDGEIIIESARRITYKSNMGTIDYFSIYANEYGVNEDEDY